ncbi:MAG: TIGR03663 family protein [Acidobacteria bacterium]|nr:TIGR03663 family protein [Acidobacteriota bacterium]
MKKTVFCSLFAVALVLGFGFRLARLDLRPMHHDEANQAIRFGILLETGEYRYDRNDHHGPTLYYLTLPSARVRGQKTLSSLDECTLRLVPVIFGGCLILLFCLLTKDLGQRAVVTGAFLAALSPALTYYSRFYIQESLLAFFILGFLIALGKYLLRPNFVWALWTGAFAGLAYATKETSVILIIAAAAACILAGLLHKKSNTIPVHENTASRDQENFQMSPGQSKPNFAICSAHFFAAAGIAVLIAVVLYTSFFSNPSGILESIRAFGIYLHRGIDPGIHAHSWSYYLQILSFSSSEGSVWTEGLILVLALAGTVFTFSANRMAKKGGISAVALFWLRYICSYSVLVAAVFSIIRYKTPWNLIHFHIGFILLAGCGASLLLQLPKTRVLRGLFIIVVVGAGCHLGLQNWKANYRYPADTRNPYVYSQTSPDYLRLAGRVADVAALHPDGEDMLIKVIAGPHEQWPLPWYVRNMRRVGYWTNTEEAGRLDDAPVLIASRENAEELEATLGDRYISEFYGLRPWVLLTLYIERTLWERFLESTVDQ